MYTQNHNFICCFVWVWNLVSHTKEEAYMEDVWERGVGENIWNEEDGNDRRLEKTA
jgi:hypothetical protein